jgi:hypothetical protein
MSVVVVFADNQQAQVVVLFHIMILPRIHALLP